MGYPLHVIDSYTGDGCIYESSIEQSSFDRFLHRDNADLGYSYRYAHELFDSDMGYPRVLADVRYDCYSNEPLLNLIDMRLNLVIR